MLEETASLSASAMWTTQHGTSILTRFWPPVLWNAALSLSVADVVIEAEDTTRARDRRLDNMHSNRAFGAGRTPSPAALKKMGRRKTVLNPLSSSLVLSINPVRRNQCLKK